MRQKAHEPRSTWTLTADEVDALAKKVELLRARYPDEQIAGYRKAFERLADVQVR